MPFWFELKLKLKELTVEQKPHLGLLRLIMIDMKASGSKAILLLQSFMVNCAKWQSY